MPSDNDRTPLYWATRIGVILAVTGSAVGLGNFLRFPGLAAKYEGGAFMIPYFIALLLLGLPMAWVEWGIGRYGGRHGFNSAPGIYRTIWKNRAAPYFGVVGMLVPVVIFMYYVVIESWCLGYAIQMATGQLSHGAGNAQAYSDAFASMTGVGGHGMLVQGSGAFPLLLLLGCFILNFGLIYRGLNKGIEWFCVRAMPLLLICALVVLVRVLTLPANPDHPERNVLSGLGFMWNPRIEGGKSLWEALANGQMWLEAAGQIFFSLSVGFGIVINYASYVRKDEDIALSALTSASGNEFCEVALGGLITIPAAFIFLGVAGATAGTFGLGFQTLPHVFASMGPSGMFVGTLFFVLLFLAALTSSLSMLQPAIALLEEGLGLGRRAAVAMLGFVTLVGSGFVFYFSGGLTALDTLDFWAGTFFIYILATFQVILFGWVLGTKKGMEEVNRGAELRIPAFVGFIIKYVSPAYLLIIFAVWAFQQITAEKDNRFKAIVSDPVVAMSVGFIILVAVLFTLLIAASVRRWNALEAARGDGTGRGGAEVAS